MGYRMRIHLAARRRPRQRREHYNFIKIGVDVANLPDAHPAGTSSDPLLQQSRFVLFRGEHTFINIFCKGVVVN